MTLNALVCRRLPASRLPSFPAGRCLAKLCLRTPSSNRAAQCPFSLRLTRLLVPSRRRQRSSSSRSHRSRGSQAWFLGHSQERTSFRSTASPGTSSAPVRICALFCLPQPLISLSRLTEGEAQLMESRRQAVKDAFRHAWCVFDPSAKWSVSRAAVDMLLCVPSGLATSSTRSATTNCGRCVGLACALRVLLASQTTRIARRPRTPPTIPGTAGASLWSACLCCSDRNSGGLTAALTG